MFKKIAVILDESEQITTIEDGCRIRRFQKNKDNWEQDRDIPIRLNISGDIACIRDEIRMIIKELADCRIIVSRKMTGLPYQSFAQEKYHIFEADSLYNGIFDDIVEEISTAQKQNAKQQEISKEPVSPEGDGRYILDLIELQKVFPEISSKKALMRFLQTQPFLSLELICNHMPPWMETVIEERGLGCHQERIKNGLKVVIYQKGCETI